MPNQYQKTLYKDLMNLVESSECFYYKDFELGNTIYRIFSYRLASYDDFLKPNALECRGHMFEIEDDTVVRLASLPPEKFFNLYENSFTTDLDLSAIVSIEEKMDGMLMSSFIHSLHRSPILRLKSKGSISSSFCVDAMNWLKKDENIELLQEIRTLTQAGYTINFEWCSPTDRIVIGHNEPHLVALNIRDNRTGEYIDRDSLLVYNHPYLQSIWVKRIRSDDPVNFVQQIPEQEDIEGYVVRLPSNQYVKIKTNWYWNLHFNKERINIPSWLYVEVLDETTDDLQAMFHDDTTAIQSIENMKNHVRKIHNHYVDIVERFYERNKNLERKEYALLGKKELPSLAFPLAMNKFVGREFCYKQWMKKHWKEFKPKSDENEN